MELWRKKNTETRIVFPIVKNDGTFISAATGLDSEYALVNAHGGTAPSFADCEHEATEIGSTGLYYLDVAAGELNGDYGAVIQVKSSTTGALTQVIIVRTFPEEVDAVKVSGTAQTAGDLAALITTVDDYIDTEVAAIKAKTDNLPALPAATGDIPTAAAVADAVWNEAQGDHIAEGSTGNYLYNTYVSLPGNVADAVCDEALSGHTTSGTLAAVLALIQKLLRNKVVTNPSTGVMTVYDDDGTTTLFTANVYEDVAGAVPFDGTGANRRDRLA